MKNVVLYIVFTALLAFSQYACSDDDLYTGDCFIPVVNVNEVVNMNLPEYFKLQNLGEHIYLNAGHRGIFVVHNYDDMYYALERTCPYQADLACSQIVVDSLNLQLRCGADTDTGFVQCCASKYMLDGRLLEGPSRCNLKFYKVNIQNNHLYINN